jgi:hypothetical protein
VVIGEARGGVEREINELGRAPSMAMVAVDGGVGARRRLAEGREGCGCSNEAGEKFI